MLTNPTAAERGTTKETTQKVVIVNGSTEILELLESVLGTQY